MALVDTNVLIDILADDAMWFDWSFDQLERALRSGPVFINDVIYAEASIRYRTIEQFEFAIAKAGVVLVAVPKEALFVAGKAFTQYRRAGGTRTGVLPDFFIGAHAEAARLPLITRDPRRYRTYFPKVQLIAPDAN